MTIDMDYSSFDKPKLWLNIAIFALCCVMVGYLCFEGGDGRHDLFGMLLFGIFAVNSLFRVYSYFKLDRIRKSAPDEKELVRAERRQGLVISIFSNAMFLLLLFLFLIPVRSESQKVRQAVVGRDSTGRLFSAKTGRSRSICRKRICP